MFPRNTGNSLSHGGSGNRELTSKFTLRKITKRMQSTKFNNLGFGKLVLEMPFAFRGTAPSFGKHVLNVVGIVSKEQMIWPHTARIVAFVKHPQSVRNFPIRQLPCKTMRSNQFVRRKHQHSIPLRLTRCGPQPTTFRLSVNFTPKSLFKCLLGPSRHNPNDITPAHLNTTK